MQKATLLSICILSIFASCSQQKPAGKRIFLAKGNISFILPDSSLTYRKPILWPSDYKLSSYGEAGASYYSRDSSTIITVYVNAHPDPEQSKVQWRVLADEKRQRKEIFTTNRNLAVIENFAADSSTHTITIDYRMPSRAEKGWRGQASYERNFTFYGPQRTIEFWFFAPDNATNRQAIATACASVYVDSTYLHAGAKPYSAREYHD